MVVSEQSLIDFATCLYEGSSGLMEVRYKREFGMGQAWYGVDRLDESLGLIERLAQETDVYVGVAPRTVQRGGKDAIATVPVLWVDLDTEEAIRALNGFDRRPSMVIDSGGGRHAYWRLEEPLAPVHAERANRRLAHALGADMKAVDAARILRPPRTLNHKYDPPVPVRLIHASGERHEIRNLVGGLPDPPAQRAAVPAVRPASVSRGGDPLLTIAPPEYVFALCGERPGRDGKICCPFHDERTPSLHVYPDAARGWICFGCGRGGSIYDFAALLWQCETRGRDFVELRSRIAQRLLHTPVEVPA